MKETIDFAHVEQFKNESLSQLLSSNTYSDDQIKDLIRDYYRLILCMTCPDLIVIKDSPTAAWKFIQENKCENPDEPYIEPCDISIESAGYYKFYEYAVNHLDCECPPDLKEKLVLATKLIHLGKIFAFDDVCVVSKKPLETHWKNDQLHNEKGMAVKFEDGTGTYHLNGIKVPSYVVEIDADFFTKEQVLNERNADVRREIIRKLGNERLFKLFDATTLDEMEVTIPNHEGDVKHTYQLLAIDLGDKRRRPFLKMVNPSIGTTHIEGVHPKCETVKDALAWCDGEEAYEQPIVLT